MDKNSVILNLYSSDEIIKNRILDLNEWYEGDIEEIDNNEYRVKKKISKIKATQYNSDGNIHCVWITYYDTSGRLIRHEKFDNADRLLKCEEITYDENGSILKNT